ncbi:hypothetical protein D5H75_03070 [Bailinhaonella thermotolerans]|uniref:Uncharacterized protein n=1 Tax=Bailinhaonella thermotolerans TaxID=1070861 RepID=A0A3A4BA42_9ACTN|nr:hypothetical protein D5H75_03070 [Bailinhaonella thermotolerans]
MAGLAVAAPAPASADVSSVIDKCAGAAAKAGTLYLSHLKREGDCQAPDGTYHYAIEYTADGREQKKRTSDHTYAGKQLIFKVPLNVPAGTKICAELLLHDPKGGQPTSMGRPCTQMRPANPTPSPSPTKAVR